MRLHITEIFSEIIVKITSLIESDTHLFPDCINAQGISDKFNQTTVRAGSQNLVRSEFQFEVSSFENLVHALDQLHRKLLKTQVIA